MWETLPRLWVSHISIARPFRTHGLLAGELVDGLLILHRFQRRLELELGSESLFSWHLIDLHVLDYARYRHVCTLSRLWGQL